MGNYEEINVEAVAQPSTERKKENLKAAIAGENYESTQMYPEFAETAEKEGLTEIAKRLKPLLKLKSIMRKDIKTSKRSRGQHGF